jgi:hypothetical protein
MPKKEQLSKEVTKLTSSPDAATKMLLTSVVLLRLSKNWTSLLPLDVIPENTNREIAVKRTQLEGHCLAWHLRVQNFYYQL